MDAISNFFRSHRGDVGGKTTTSLPLSADGAGGERPKITLLEFFQSQSCDSCPPANDALIDFVSKPGIESSYLLLTYHVTYWNHLSWRDTFSYQGFDVRQREYARRRGNEHGIYTPMLVVNGRSVGVGNTKSAVVKLIADGQPNTSTDDKIPGGQVKLGVETNQYGEQVVNVDATAVSSQPGGGDLHVLVIRYIKAPKDVLVLRGENAGRTLPHQNVVTSVTRIGYLQRECRRPYVLPPNGKVQGEGRAVVVQDGSGGVIMDVVVLE